MENVRLAMVTRMCCHPHTETWRVWVYRPMFSCLHTTFDLLGSVSTITNTQYAESLWRWEFARLCRQLLSCSPTPHVRRPPGRPRQRRIESQFSHKRAIHCSRCNGIGHNRSKCNNSLSWHVPFLCLYDSNILYHPIHSIIGYMVRGCWFSFLCIGLVIGTMPYFVIFMI